MNISDNFNFLVNDEDEVMLIIYQREGEPDNPTVEVDRAEHTVLLVRSNNDNVVFPDIPDDIFDSMQEADKLLVCELTFEENEEDTRIAYAYEAEIRD